MSFRGWQHLQRDHWVEAAAERVQLTRRADGWFLYDAHGVLIGQFATRYQATEAARRYCVSYEEAT